MSYRWRGYGKVTGTITTAQDFIIPDGDYSYECSVFNAGDTNTLFALVNTLDADGEFDSTIAVPLAPQQSYVWGSDLDHSNNLKITSVTISGDGAGSIAHIAFN